MEQNIVNTFIIINNSFSLIIIHIIARKYIIKILLYIINCLKIAIRKILLNIAYYNPLTVLIISTDSPYYICWQFLLYPLTVLIISADSSYYIHRQALLYLLTVLIISTDSPYICWQFLLYPLTALISADSSYYIHWRPLYLLTVLIIISIMCLKYIIINIKILKITIKIYDNKNYN